MFRSLSETHHSGKDASLQNEHIDSEKKQNQGKGKTAVTWLEKTGRLTEEDNSQPGFKNEVISLQLIKINEKKKKKNAYNCSMH